MTRIEDALRQLKEEQRSVGNARSGLRRSADEVVAAPLRPFTLETANHIQLDPVALRRWGPVTLLGNDARSKREYGQIKRPIINLALGRGGQPVPAGNVVVVTSALPGEGKSVTTLNLALSVAREKDLSVIVVDADMAKPDLSQALGLAQARGLADLIADDALKLGDVLWQTSIEGFYAVPAGRNRAGATELLGSQRMKLIVDAFAHQLPRTIIIFDSSPLLLTNESPVLVSVAGQTILVVRANKTPRQVVADALARLDSTKPIGLVLNGAESDAAGYYNGGAYSVGGAEADSGDGVVPHVQAGPTVSLQTP